MSSNGSEPLDRLREVVIPVAQWLCRPRVRLTLTGVVLLLVGGVFVTSSVWTLPLVIAGALMVAVAWLGRRLDGRLAVEWGESGTQLEFRAQIKAAEPPLELAPAPVSAARLAPTSEPEPEDADVVEGEAHTVEIEVAELKALIAAAASAGSGAGAEAGTAPADAGAQAARSLRVAHGGGRKG
jgi:hypothetical protein